MTQQHRQQPNLRSVPSRHWTMPWSRIGGRKIRMPLSSSSFFSFLEFVGTYHDDVIKWKHFPRYCSLCAGNSPVTGEFPSQRPVTRSFDVFFDLRLNKRFSKQSRRRWFETLSPPLWRHCNSFIRSPQGICVTGHATPAVLNYWFMTYVNTFRPRQNARYFPDDIFMCVFLNKNVWISIKISLKLVPWGPINNISALVQIMA